MKKMKKILFGLAFLILATLHARGVEVQITMNSTSRTMTLAKKNGGELVAVGTPNASYVYNFTAEAGDYILTGYNSSSVSNGTMEISIYEGGEVHDGGAQDGKIFKVATITAGASNTGWVLGTDYSMECHAGSREGIVRIINPVEVSGKKIFLMCVGDSYRLILNPSSTRVTEGFIGSFNQSSTVTATSATVNVSVPKSKIYSITIPKMATLYVGGKWGAILQSTGGTHYVPFIDMFPIDSVINSDTKTYKYSLGEKCTYNYRVTQPGKLTNGGIFTITTNTDGTMKIAPMVITDSMMNLQEPTYINHDVSIYSGANVADILMNINAQGHLKLKSGEAHQIVNLRSWQLTDNSTNNYFIEPDFHYTILGLDGQPSNDVIEIDKNGVIRTKGSGTAIVQITYDAINLQVYNTSSTEKSTNFYYGALWSALWPENTGTFVVSVDQDEDVNMKSNFTIETALTERIDEGNMVDAEHDVFYYLENKYSGYYYTFKPQGVTKVEVANPDIITNPNKALYSGFSTANVTQTDTSYTVLLKHGRNILKLTTLSGKTTYQILSAKPVSYKVTNASRATDTLFYPGDSVKVQFSGFFHPANKLAGIYNMSAYLYYNGVPNGTSLILGPGQYTFAGQSAAQAFHVVLPSNGDKDTVYLKTGAIQVNGFGSLIGKHRSISLSTGINPNFTAAVHVNFWGSIPDAAIPVQKLTDGVKFQSVPEGVNMLVKNQRGDTILPNTNGEYLCGARTYSYEAFAYDRKASLGNFTIVAGQGIQTINISMDAVATTDTSWDGTSIVWPEQVTAMESGTTGGIFEGMEGYYKIKNGYELAWFSYFINKAKDVNKTSAVLVRNIDLANYEWKPIGTSSSLPFSGTFQGKDNTISGIKINSTANNCGLFGYAQAARIYDVTTAGNISSTGNYVGGIVGDFEYSSGNPAAAIRNCHNKSNVSGAQYVGGIVGKSYQYPSTSDTIMVIENCSNSGNITASNQYAGGIGGYMEIFYYNLTKNHTFKKLSNSGNITAGTKIAGGIAGIFYGLNLENAYNTGIIATTNQSESGGLIGRGDYQKFGTIVTNAYNTGVVSGGNAIIGDLYSSTKGVSLINVYTLSRNFKTSDTTVVKTETQFVSGEMAWLLGSAFGQNLTTDTLPVFTSQKVFRICYTNNLDEAKDTIYTNGTLPLTTRGNYVGTWLTAENGVAISTVSNDITLYMLFTSPASSVTLSRTILSIVETDTHQLVATVLPENATNKNVGWSSSNTAIATVSANGLVTAIAEGTVKIVVLTNDGNYSDTCFVEVAKNVVLVSGISLDIHGKSLKVDSSFQLMGTVLPENATNTNVSWSSLNIAIATVDANGLVTAIVEGTVKIVVLTNDGNFSDTCFVEVTKNAVLVSGISLDIHEKSLKVDSSFQLIATVLPENATNKNVGWSSSNTAIATVDANGLVTAIAEGTANITVTTLDGEFTASCAITVTNVSTGIEQPEITKNKVYPTITTGLVHIIVQNKMTEPIQIIDVSGKIYQTIRLQSLENTIDISSYKSGLYFIRLGNQTVKIIKR